MTIPFSILGRTLQRPPRRSRTKEPLFRFEELDSRCLMTASPLGPEVAINTYTTGVQQSAQVAAASDGSYVVVWQGAGAQDVDGIYAQRFGSDGSALGSQFLINEYTTGVQANADIAMDADGDFIVVWDGPGFNDNQGIFARRFDAVGNAVSGDFRVNNYTSYNYIKPSVAMNDMGAFVVAWQDAPTAFPDGVTFTPGSTHINTRLYDADGDPWFEQQDVTYTQSSMNQDPPNPNSTTLNASVAIDNSGGFIVVWQDDRFGDSDGGIYGRYFSAISSNPQGAPFQINTTTAGVQEHPEVIATRTGQYIVTWSGAGSGDSDGVFMRRFTTSQNTIDANEIRVNSTTTGAQSHSSVAGADNGDFVVVWQSQGQDGDGAGIYAQQFLANGSTAGSELLVNSTTTGDQAAPSVASDSNGNFVVVWDGAGPADADGIHAQRFGGQSDQTPPIVTSVQIGSKIVRQEFPSDFVTEEVSSLIVSFSEAMATSGAGSVTDINNWQLTYNGVAVTGIITSVDYAYNSTSRKYEATLHFDQNGPIGSVVPLTGGSYALTAKSSLTDAAGRALDGGDNGTAGVNYNLSFDVRPIGKIGNETLVNSASTAGVQSSPSVAAGGPAQTGTAWVDADGSIRSIVHGVATTVAASGSNPVIAKGASNWFNVVWEGASLFDPDGGITAATQVYLDGGSIGTNSEPVNEYTAGAQQRPDIKSFSDHSVVVWDGAGYDYTNNVIDDVDGIYVRVGAGSAFGVGSFIQHSIRVNQTVAGAQRNAHIAGDRNGNFVVVWESENTVTNQTDVYFRLFNSSGTALSNEIRVGSNAAWSQDDPVVAMEDDGAFVVAWRDGRSDGGDIIAQRFDREGSTLGNQFVVNTYLNNVQSQPSIAMDRDGNFTIVWRSEGQDGDAGGIFGQRFLASGARQGSEFIVNYTTAGDQHDPEVTIASASGFMRIGWAGAGNGDSDGIFRQDYGTTIVYRGLTDVTVAEDASASTLDLDSGFASPNSISYFIIASNPSIFAGGVSPQADANHQLTLNYAANASGSSTLYINALSGSAVFTAEIHVTVTAVNDPPQVVGAGIGPVNESTSQPINLASYFSDVENTSAGLAYSIYSITDGTLFNSPAITGTNLNLNFAANAFGTSQVTIRATDSAGAYVDNTFTVTLQGGAPTDDSYEPNDTIAAAANLGAQVVPGTSLYFANIDQADDVDYFQFTLASAAKITVQTIANQLGGALDSVLRLFNGSQQEINRSDDVVGRDSFISRTLSAGNYYLAVSSFANTIGNYRLSLTASEIAPVILKMTPDATLANAPTAIRLFLDGPALDPTTVTTSSFTLTRQAPDLSTSTIANPFSSSVYDAASKTITLTVQTSMGDGRYTLAGGGAIRDASGSFLLDGDRDGVSGGNFTGSFGVDTTAPGGSLLLAGVAGSDATGVLYSFSGSINEQFPAVNGENLRVEVDVDGDGFDDGSATVSRSGSSTNYSVSAAQGVAANQGAVNVRARFVDARGNVSAPVSVAINTNVPRVVGAVASGSTIAVTYDGSFNNLVSAGVTEPDVYLVSGRGILSVTWNGSTNIATLNLDGGALQDGAYTLTVYSGPVGVNRDGVQLDGDGNGTPGGDFRQTLVVDSVAPVITTFQIAAGEDTGTNTTDGLTNSLQPTFTFAARDVFPSTSTGSLTVQLDVDGDGFDDGDTQIFLRNGNSTSVTVQVNRLLAAETYSNVRARAIDAAGSTSAIALLSTAYPSGLRIDRGGPSAAVATTPIANGFRTTFTFDELVDSAAVAAIGSYQLVDSSGNAVSLSGRLAFSVSTISGSRTQVRVDVNLAGLPGDQYRFALIGSSVTDLAGNEVIGGNPGATLDYSAVGPSVSSTAFASALNGAAADQLVVQFDPNVSVDATTAGNPANYTLVGPSGAIAFTVSFNANSNRTTLRVAGGGDFAAGQYTLTISANVQSVAGVALAGGAYSTSVTAPAASGAAGLNSLVFDGVVNALDTRTQSVASQTDEAQKAASQAALAERILDDIEVTVDNYLLANPGATSANIAGMINARIVQLFSDNLLATFQNLDFLPKEYVIVWSRDASFLLRDPSDDANIAGVDRVEIGYTLDGAAVTQVVGATLAGSPNSDSGLSLAIVPVNGLRKFLSNGVPVRVDGLASTPDRTYSLDLTGIESSNQAGVITFGANGPAVLPSYVDAAVNDVSVKTIDLSNVVVGLDTNLQSFNDQVLAGVLAAVGGDLSKLGSRSIVLWFDPVDFVLTTPSGQRLGHDGTTNYHEIDGAYYSGNGRTELVVIPEALAGRYYLTLFGAGSEFRGVANFLHNGQLTPAALQGSLGATGVFGGINALGVILDFGSAANPQPTLPPNLAPFITGVGNSLQLADFQTFLRTASTLAGTFTVTATVAPSGGGESVSALASLFNATANQAALAKPAASLIDLLDQIFSEPINIGELSADALAKVVAAQLGIDANSLPIESVSTISSALTQTLAPSWHAWSGLFNHWAKQSTQAAQTQSLPSAPSVNNPTGPAGDRQTNTESATPNGVGSLFHDWQEDLAIALAADRSSDEAADRATPALLAGMTLGSTMFHRLRRRSAAPAVSAC